MSSQNKRARSLSGSLPQACAETCVPCSPVSPAAFLAGSWLVSPLQPWAWRSESQKLVLEGEKYYKGFEAIPLPPPFLGATSPWVVADEDTGGGRDPHLSFPGSLPGLAGFRPLFPGRNRTTWRCQLPCWCTPQGLQSLRRAGDLNTSQGSSVGKGGEGITDQVVPRSLRTQSHLPWMPPRTPAHIS